MKTKLILLTISSSLVLFNCSNEIIVRSDYDKEVTLSSFKSYTWLPTKDIEARNNPLLYNELADKRIKNAVDLQLKSKDIPLVSDNSDLKVHYHIILENKSVVRPIPYGYYYSPYWTRNQMDVYLYQQGTLIIDLMDATNNNLVWRGWAIAVMNDDNPGLDEKSINEAVYRILKQFPPKR